MPVLESTFGAPGKWATVHPASTVCHRWRPARLPASRSRSAAFRRCISKSMRLILRFGPYPTPSYVADNCLPAFVDVDVFDRDFLLSLAAMPVQSLQQGGVGTRKLVCPLKFFAPVNRNPRFQTRRPSGCRSRGRKMFDSRPKPRRPGHRRRPAVRAPLWL
jgi:hypothetical protein